MKTLPNNDSVPTESVVLAKDTVIAGVVHKANTTVTVNKFIADILRKHKFVKVEVDHE